MEKQLWNKVKTTFFSIMEAPESERIELLEKICTDPVVQSEVMRLLSYETTVSRIDQNHQVVSNLTDIKEIGPYRVLNLLGEGGMGKVFLVEKKESEFQQKFALKLMGSSFDSDSFYKRFNMERHILASLNHPNIARFNDGGISSHGPYFCMEYIEGKTIDKYCDDHNLSITERLNLFSQVFEAVKFAHQHFIVHRDLKPGNILVNDRGIVKLLDFGIAKLMDGHQSNNFLLSQLTKDHNQGPMTPLYASPEQYLGEPITSASDVYGLGLVLYQLITGQLAYDLSKKSFMEIDSLIVKQMPTKPSERCSEPNLKGTSSTKIALNRNTTIEKLKNTLKGDLDTVLLKSLQKDPEQRYSSVADFQQDLENFLNRKPISARSPSFYYRTKMFVQRHKYGVLFSTILLLSILIGTISTLVAWQNAVDARNITQIEKNKAVSEANKSKEILNFVETMLSSADPGEMGKEAKIVEALARSAAILDDEFRQQPEIKAAIHFTIGKTYGSLGDFDKGINHLQHACEIRKTLFPEDDRTLLEYESSLGAFYQELGALDQALEILERLDRQMTVLFGKEDRSTLLNSINLVRLFKKKGELKKAEEMVNSALKIQIQKFGEDDEDSIASMSVLGGLLAEQSRFEEALTQHSKVYSLMRKKHSEEHPSVLKARENVATIIIRQGKFAEAEAELKTVLTLKKKVMGEKHPATFITVINLTTSLVEQGKFEEAKSLSLAYLDIVKEKLGEDHVLTMDIMNGLANCYSGLKEYEKVRGIQEALLALKIKKFGPEHSQSIISMINLGNSYSDLGYYKKGLELHQRGYIASKKILGEEHFYCIASLIGLSLNSYLLGQKAQGISMMEEAHNKLITLFGKNHSYVLYAEEKLKLMREGDANVYP